jgi:hypothetical protein
MWYDDDVRTYIEFLKKDYDGHRCKVDIVYLEFGLFQGELTIKTVIDYILYEFMIRSALSRSGITEKL